MMGNIYRPHDYECPSCGMGWDASSVNSVTLECPSCGYSPMDRIGPDDEYLPPEELSPRQGGSR